MNPDEKTCPFCLKTIKAGALRCKDCHADLTDTAPAPAGTSPNTIALNSEQVLDLLSALVNKNLAVYEETEDGQGRYRLLATVRQYGGDRLLENKEARALRARHRDHFLALAEEAATKLKGSEQAEWLETLESEHENLRAALERCLNGKAQNAEAGLRLAGALSPFWGTHGHLAEGRAWCEAALSRPGAQARTKARAEALHGAGVLALMQGDYASAGALLKESLTTMRELGDKQGIAIALGDLGLVASEQGDYTPARSLHEEGLVLRTELGDEHGIAGSLNDLGVVANLQGDYASARTLFEKGLAIQRKLRDKRGMAASLVNLGSVAWRERDYAASRHCLADCLSLCRVLGDKRITAYALEGCAALAKGQEQPDRATWLYGASDALRESIGVPLSPKGCEKADSDLTALRATLGEAAFDSAWTAGRAMIWEQAIEYALEDGSA